MPQIMKADVRQIGFFQQLVKQLQDIARIETTWTYYIIYLPTRDETFTTILSQGAYLNGTPINLSQVAELEKAIIHAGDIMKGGNPTITKKRLEDISKLLIQARRIRMIGTAATDLVYIACGRTDMLVNHAKDPWDIEAGKLLLLEAGGKATVQHGHDNEILSIYSNGGIHSEAESLLFS